MTNKLNNSQVILLFNLRTQCVRGIKDNFHGQNYQHLKCDLCENEMDTQKHILECHVLRKHVHWNHEEIKYEHIFGTLKQQISVTILLSSLLEVRDGLLAASLPPHPPRSTWGGKTCRRRGPAYRGSEIPDIQTLQ